MIRYIKITLLLLMVGTVGVWAQQPHNPRSADKSFFRYKDAQFVRQQAKMPVAKETVVVIPQSKFLADPADTLSVALYRGWVKKNGWVCGQGLITAEQASHLATYYRLSRKNKAGHWTSLECFDGYGKPRSNGATYLINPYDSDDKQIDEQWRDKLKEIVRWEFVGDNSGENCVQENAYDEDGKLILSYSTVKVGERKYMSHYVDAWGIPVIMRDRQGAKYVLVERDKNGYEADVSFIGDDGFNKSNRWGAFREKYVFNENGYKTQHMSGNVDGSYMLDQYGNSGQRQTFNKAGQLTSVTNIDQYERIIRVPLGKRADEDYIRKNYYYDQWGRDTLVANYLADGVTPDTTSFGLHATRTTYNDHGTAILYEFLGLDGRPACNRSGVSVIRRDYDDVGNQIRYECRDAKGRFINYNFCLGLYRYEGTTMVESKEYRTTNGLDTICTFRYLCEGNRVIKEWPESDLRQVCINDDQYNEIERVYSTLDGTPKMCSDGFCKRTEVYTRRPGFCQIERCYWDIKGKLVSLEDPQFKQFMNNTVAYNRLITLCDTLNSTMTYKRYDGHKLISLFRQRLTKDMEDRLGQTSIDLTGNQARSHYSDGLYYDAYTGNTVKGGWSIGYVSISNEFGETGYMMVDDSNSPNVYAFNPYGESNYLDEDGNAIGDMKKFRDKLPRAFMIEIYDSVKAPRYDIQSGDVIMRYGDWHHPKLTTSKGYNLREATFKYAKEPKTMVVMRRNPATNQAETREIVLGPGLPADYGFYFHAIYMTRKEASRYKETYQAYEASLPEALKTGAKADKETTDTLLFMRPYRVRGESKNLYGRGVVDDAVLLGIVTMDADGHCHQFRSGNSGNSVEVFDSCRFVKNREIQKLWFTTDLRTVRSVDLRGESSYWDAEFWYNSTVDERIYQPAQLLMKDVGKQMDAFVQQAAKAYEDSLFAKYGVAWPAVKNDSVRIVVGRVEGDEGYMVKNGYSGLYVVLEWCGWKCTDGYDQFMPAFEQHREQNKQVLLMSVESRDNVDFFGDIVSISSDEPLLGLQMMNTKVNYDYFKKNILDKYLKYKKYGTDL